MHGRCSGKICGVICAHAFKDFFGFEPVYYDQCTAGVKGRHHRHINPKIIEQRQGTQQPVFISELIKIAYYTHAGQDRSMGLSGSLGLAGSAGCIENCRLGPAVRFARSYFPD